MELAFYFLWFLLFACLIVSADYNEILIEPIIYTVSLMFFVILTLLPPVLYHIVFSSLEVKPFDKRSYYLPATLFIVNTFCVIYFGVQKDEENFTYEVVENVMTYVNYITILFIFPITTVYFSYLSFKKLKPIKFSRFIKPKSTEDFLLVFVLLYDLYIVIWVFQNYILPDSLFKSFLKGYYLFYFVFSYWILYKVFKKSNLLNIDENSDFQFDLEELNNKLEKAILEDKVFLNPKLTVKLLATQIDSNEKYMSYLINKKYDKNFSNFINEHRIEFAKKILVDKDYNQYTIEAIGGLSGFNSKSGFNTFFKKYTGLTPSQYKKEKVL
ncbi:helix-turn-helix domain-containing protein [Aurantibacter sp.]|uniref:helix-turn-helix domain-containing protein n=1 Tax=Aurantibacter sp. TaxID=2807103 RepID=UPI0035C86E68